MSSTSTLIRKFQETPETEEVKRGYGPSSKNPVLLSHPRGKRIIVGRVQWWLISSAAWGDCRLPSLGSNHELTYLSQGHKPKIHGASATDTFRVFRDGQSYLVLHLTAFVLSLLLPSEKVSATKEQDQDLFLLHLAEEGCWRLMAVRVPARKFI